MTHAFPLEIGQRLCWVLVHSTWQFALLAILLIVGLRLLRDFSAHMRYCFMLCALCAIPLAAAATFFAVRPAFVMVENDSHAVASDRKLAKSGKVSQIGEPINHGRLGETDLHANAVYVGRQGAENVLAVEPFNDSRRSASAATKLQTIRNVLNNIATTAQRFIAQWTVAILIVWFFGMMVLSIRLLISWRATHILRTRGRAPIPDCIAKATARIAERLRIIQAIEITQSTLVEVPAVIGWLKPLVLLPASAISGLAMDQMEAVIAHELAHVRRHDYLVNLFQLFLETVFFYHPAVWWVSRVIRVEREACCDDIAVLITGDRIGYATLLLRLEESRIPPTQVALGMSSRGGMLLGRICRIVSAPTPVAGVGPLALATAVFLMFSAGAILVMSVGSMSAQEETNSKHAPQDIATIRSWMQQSIEFEDWSHLTGLAKRMAEAGEYEEALEWIMKIPLGKYNEGKFPPDAYYKVISEICEIALAHDRLDFVENALEQLLNPEKQSATSKQFPPKVFDVAIAILEFHLSKGEIDKALVYLDSHPFHAHGPLVRGAAAKALHDGHPDHVEEFNKRLMDPQLRSLCQMMLANYYYWHSEPDKIWQLANQLAIDHPEDLLAQATVRDTAMHSYSKVAPERFVELVPACRAWLARLPDAKTAPGWDSAQMTIDREQMTRLADADRVRYTGSLALYAAYAKQYELAVELSANVPMLTTSGSATMDLSGSDRHPVLYAVTELQKQRKFVQALNLIDLVKNDAVALASLARLADQTGFGAERAKYQDSFQKIVERLTQSYVAFAQKHDEATVIDTYEGLPESLHLHLQRIADPALSAIKVPYFNPGRLLTRSEYYDFLIEQDRVKEIVQHVEGVLREGKGNEAEWIVRILAQSAQTEAYEYLQGQVQQAFVDKKSNGPFEQSGIWKNRQFLAISALSAYNAGQRDLCYETFMKLDRNWMSPSMVSQVAYKARESGDMEFLRRMESSSSPLMREAALEALAVHFVLIGDIEAAKATCETFDREFGENHKSWSIYRTITDERLVTDPNRLLAALQLASQQVPLESKDYPVFAVQRAKLHGRLYPAQPLPRDWLDKFDQNAKLKYEVELAHAFGVWGTAE